MVRFPTLVVTRQRIEGLEQAIAESETKVRYKVLACSDDDTEFDAEIAAAFKPRAKPSGIIFSNGIIAARATPMLRRRGIAYPKDVSLLTLDNPGWSELVTPRVVIRRATEPGTCRYRLALLGRAHAKSGNASAPHSGWTTQYNCATSDSLPL